MKYFYAIRREDLLEVHNYKDILKPLINNTIEDFYKRGLIITPIKITKDEFDGYLDITYCAEFDSQIDPAYLLEKERLEIGL